MGCGETDEDADRDHDAKLLANMKNLQFKVPFSWAHPVLHGFES